MLNPLLGFTEAEDSKAYHPVPNLVTPQSLLDLHWNRIVELLPIEPKYLNSHLIHLPVPAYLDRLFQPVDHLLKSNRLQLAYYRLSPNLPDQPAYQPSHKGTQHGNRDEGLPDGRPNEACPERAGNIDSDEP